MPRVFRLLPHRRIQSVELLRGLALAAEIDQVRNRRLHAVGDLVVLDRGFDLFVSVQAGEVAAVETFHKPQSFALQSVGFARRDVGERLLLGRVDKRRLMDGRQKTVAKNVHAAQRSAAAGQHHEARQVLILAAQAVARPGARAGISGEREAGVDEVISLRVLVRHTGHRADDGQVVRARAEVGEQLADGQTRLAVIPKFPRAGHDVAVLVEHGGPHRQRHRLAVVTFQARLGIERVHM